MSRLRRAVRRLLQVVISSLVTFLAAELVARVVFDPVPEHPGAPEGATRRRAPEGPDIPAGLQFVPRPGAVRTVVLPGHGDEPDQTLVYQINADGFRGERVPLERTPGVLRIAALGDSFTYGTGVEQPHTWPAQLERALEERLGEGSVEMLNWGVEAYNTRQEAAFLEWKSPLWQPDLVILCMYINDASGESRGTDAAQGPKREPRWETTWIERLGLRSGVWPRGEERSSAQRVTNELRRASRLIDVLAHRAYRSLRGRVTESGYVEDWQLGSAGLLMVEDGLARAARAAERGGFELVVVLYPDLASLDADYPYAEAHAMARELVEDQGLEFHDLFEALEGQDARSLHAHAHDPHPNRGCNALVAAHLAELLEARLR